MPLARRLYVFLNIFPYTCGDIEVGIVVASESMEDYMSTDR